MRRKIFSMIEIADEGDRASKIYDSFMLTVIIISLVPLAFKTNYRLFSVIDYFSTAVFILDYILRLITADLKLEMRGSAPFVIYPFTPMAVIDLVVILSALPTVSRAFRLMKTIRLIRTLRILRTMKIARYSKSLIIILDVLKKEKKSLSAVATLAVAYIVVSALVIFNIEPDSFNNFFDAIYWATVSLTTVGYGDIYPTSTLGRIVTMVSSLFGIAIIALPAGIITGGYLNEINSRSSANSDTTDLDGEN